MLRRSARTLAAISIGGLIVAAASESMLRALWPQPPSELAIYARHPRLPIYALRPEAAATIATGETHWRAFTDARGFRVDRPGDALPGTDVLVLGGTNTFGYGVDSEETFTGRLATRFPHLRFANAAVPIHGPTQYRMLLDDIVSRGSRPSVVLVGLCPGTDFNHLMLDKDLHPRSGVLIPQATLKQWLRDHSHLYRFAAQAYHRSGAGLDPQMAWYEAPLFDPGAWSHDPLATGVRRMAGEIAAIRDASIRIGAELAFVLLPTAPMLLHVRDQEPSIDPIDRLPIASRKAREILERLGVGYVDPILLLADMPAGTTHHRFDRHLTVQAHEAIARSLEERLDSMRISRPRTSAEAAGRKR